MNSSWYRINALDLALCLRCNRISRYWRPRMFFRGDSRLGNGIFWYVLMMALSRPVLGLHYPSDVLAGAAIGALLAQLVLAL